MKCLNCKTEMVNNDVLTKKAELSYDQCEKCGSLWLDKGELDKMAFSVDGDIEDCSEEGDKVPEKNRKKCPRCEDTALSPVRFLGVTDILLHRCGNCGGFWLDGEELKLIDDELAKDMPVRGKGFSEFVNNVAVPYWYKRVKKDSAATDFHVPVLPIKGSTLVKSTEDKCPACKSSLNLYSVASLQYEGCDKCKGLWLVQDELRKLKNRTEDGRLAWMNDEIENVEKLTARPTSRPCVKCKNAKLIAAVFGKSSIIIDWCPQCHGMWLDRDEFISIVAYLKDELIKEKPKDIARVVVNDFKRIFKGGPESRWDEIVDTDDAIHAMLNAGLFEHPAVVNSLLAVQKMGLPR